MQKNYGHGYKTRVFITGVSGFIGSSLATKLIEDGYEVGGLLRWSPRVAVNAEPLKGKVKLYQGNLNDYANLSFILKDFQPDYVFHLGAISPVSYSFTHPQEVTEVNYMGTINLAEACKTLLPNLKKFIFASTMEIYGIQDPNNGAFDEDTTVPVPHSPYAVAKYATELYLKHLYLAYGYPIVIARGSNTFGRTTDKYFVIEATINRMLDTLYLGKSGAINMGNPIPVRSYIHINDVVAFYQAIMESDNEKIFGESFNTGPANGCSVKELVERIAKIIGWNGQINWNTTELRAGEIMYLNTKNEKAKIFLGWTPSLTLEEGLKLAVGNWKDQRKK